MPVIQSIKVVSYYDTFLIVPQWTKFISMNKDGKIFAWESKPQTNSYLWYIFKQYRFQSVADGDPEVIEWKNSLHRYYATGENS